MSDFSSTSEGIFWDTDMSDVQTPEELLKGGGGVEKEGLYHVSCESVSLKDAGDNDKLAHLEMKFSVLAGEHEDQVEKKIYNRMYLEGWEDKHKKQKGKLSDAQVRGLQRIAWAFGLIDESDFGKPTRIAWNLMENRQAVVEVRQEKDQTVKDKDGKETIYKGRFRIPFGNSWPLGHDAVKKVPLNAEAASLVLGNGSAPFESDQLNDV